MGRSANVGRFWDSDIKKVYKTSDGNYSTAIEIYQTGQGNSRLNHETAGMHFERREHCGQEIVIDEHGFAYCQTCKLTFNDGVDAEQPEVKIIPFGYTPKPALEKAPPPRRYRKPRAAR